MKKSKWTEVKKEILSEVTSAMLTVVDQVYSSVEETLTDLEKKIPFEEEED